ncbi:MAG: response regulator transcription factor [Candidatus Obscuribacterales bacterium]|nr:response regulator transcription factor [Candidatus Obscuribacterales bacterium]
MKNTEQTKMILVICGDVRYCRTLTQTWSHFGLGFAVAHCATDGVRMVKEKDWDAIILDLVLEDIDGFEVLRTIRKQSNVPIVMISSLVSEADAIIALELGADDFVARTTSTREILARLRALLRRNNSPYCKDHGTSERIRIGILLIELPKRLALINDQVLDLTPTEYDLLLCLASTPDRIKTREELTELLKGKSHDFLDRSIDVHVSSLRRKLGDDCKSPTFIKTVRGAGYMLESPRISQIANDAHCSEIQTAEGPE